MFEIKEGWNKYGNTDMLFKDFEGLVREQYTIMLSGDGLSVYLLSDTRPGSLGDHCFSETLVRSRSLERVWGGALKKHFNDEVVKDVLEQANAYYIAFEWVEREDISGMGVKEFSEDWLLRYNRNEGSNSLKELAKKTYGQGSDPSDILENTLERYGKIKDDDKPEQPTIPKDVLEAMKKLAAYNKKAQMQRDVIENWLDELGVSEDAGVRTALVDCLEQLHDWRRAKKELEDALIYIMEEN